MYEIIIMLIIRIYISTYYLVYLTNNLISKNYIFNYNRSLLFSIFVTEN